LFSKTNFIHAWWESTKWISWKEFAQTGPDKVCDKVTMQGAVSIEITEIIWICNVMEFFFKFGKQMEKNIGFNI
jgi:predicted  nucleic acid-binding Zn ribbon protein